MIDIHCHPLADVDDGAETFETSVEMCKLAAADGITHLVATPHCNYTYQFRPEINRRKLEELQAAVGDTPKLLLGCDFHLSYENIRQLIEDRAHFTINQSSYVLVEFGEHFIPEHMDRVFYEVQVAGLIPILTHPERNPVVQRQPELLPHWVTRECLAQVTAMSLTGGFGAEVQSLSRDWLERNLIHFVASDAHNTQYRPPLLSACYKQVTEARGQEVADLLFRKNPEAVINGKPLGPQPEPLGPQPSKRKRKWFSILWGKDKKPRSG
jgi:protein-tyrosine phosphatase